MFLPRGRLALAEDLKIMRKLKYCAKIVLDALSEFPLFCGKYDAAHGSEDYMYGISTVMEMIAYYAEDNEFNETFIKNMLESEAKLAKTK